MKIWEMSVNDQSTQVTTAIRWSIDELETYDGRTKANSWQQIELVRPRGYKGKKLTDIIHFAPGSRFVLSERAVDNLYALIEDDVELLPVSVEGQPYWFMYVTTVLDCIDYDKSSYRTHLSGGISWFDALWFHKPIIIGHNLFKLKDRPTGFIYTSDAFKERASRIDPVGPSFILVWNSNNNEAIELPPFR